MFIRKLFIAGERTKRNCTVRFRQFVAFLNDFAIIYREEYEICVGKLECERAMLKKSLSVKFIKSLPLPDHLTTDSQLVSLSLTEMYFSCLVLMLLPIPCHMSTGLMLVLLYKTLGVND